MRIAYTDGSCAKPTEPGGWAWVEMTEDDQWIAGRAGYAPSTTNQRMELMAAMMAVRDLRGELLIVSDSAYVVNCFRDRWYDKWMDNGWRNGRNKDVANRDLWQPIVEDVLGRSEQEAVHFLHVRGHTGDRGNEMADTLCGGARKNRWGGDVGELDLVRMESEGFFVPRAG